MRWGSSARKGAAIPTKPRTAGVGLEVPHADPLDMTLRELFQRILDLRSPTDSGWINVRTPQLPWRQLTAAAARGEVEVCRVGRMLMMRRAELDRWLQSQKIGPTASTSAVTTEQPKATNDVSHLLTRLGFGSGTQ